jgi:hypothetical protein
MQIPPGVSATDFAAAVSHQRRDLTGEFVKYTVRKRR